MGKEKTRTLFLIMHIRATSHGPCRMGLTIGNMFVLCRFLKQCPITRPRMCTERCAGLAGGWPEGAGRWETEFSSRKMLWKEGRLLSRDS